MYKSLDLPVTIRHHTHTHKLQIDSLSLVCISRITLPKALLIFMIGHLDKSLFLFLCPKQKWRDCCCAKGSSMVTNPEAKQV